MVRESQLINSWIHEGEQRAELRLSRDYLLELIGAQLQDPVPETIRLAIEGTNDLSRLKLWYAAALKAKSIGELRKQLKLEP